MSIHLLRPDVAAKIAAGEVVERPANVAKELLENSLDAGATEIRVEIREGGQRLLRVTDNGHGIPAGEAALAFQRHATSKLADAEDLDHIATFGFRGEALYSIAAVSQVTLTSRHASEEFGIQVRVEGGQISPPVRAGAPVGVVVSVEHLFYNVPARKKFLRKSATETGQINAVVQRYALAYPERRFSLVNEGKLVFQSTGSGALFDVLVKVYGLENAKQMVQVGAPPPSAARVETGENTTDPGLAAEVDFMASVDRSAKVEPMGEGESQIWVYGFASLPTLTRANRSSIDIFINRRYVEDRSITYAVVQAYHTFLQVGRFPIAAIFVELDPALVDVNVHPQKTQVRFVDERRVFSAVQKSVRRVVIDNAAVPGMTLSNSDQLDSAHQPSGTLDSNWIARNEAIRSVGQQHALDMAIPPSAPRTTLNASAGPPDETVAPTDNGAASQAYKETTLGGAPQLPPLRVVGQVGATYIIAEGPEGMFLIDQHAAHERILYEEFMARRLDVVGGEIARQHLLEPLTLHMGGEVAGLIAQHLSELNALGFEVESFGGDSFLVRAVPAVLAGQDPLRNLEEIALALADRRNLVEEEIEARLVKMVCKRAAIKAGQLLSDIEMQELVRQLEACASPRTCPHGRPTMLQLSANELEKAFGRI